MQIGQPGRSIKQFFHDVAATHIEGSSQSQTQILNLECAYLGRSKDNLDQIELSVALDAAVPLLGGFLRYVTTQVEEEQAKNTNRRHSV